MIYQHYFYVLGVNIDKYIEETYESSKRAKQYNYKKKNSMLLPLDENWSYRNNLSQYNTMED